MRNRLLLVTALVLLAAACGGGSETTDELPVNDGNGDNAAISGACLEDEPDCNDTPDGEPTDLPQAGGGDELIPSTIQAVSAAGTAGPVAVAGFIVAVGDDLKLCEALAESFPPQCGGSSIPITSLEQVDPDDLQSEGDVTWTDYAVTLFGEMVDGTLVITPIE